MNRPGRSKTGRGTESVIPFLFELNRAGGGIASSRRSGTHDLLLILPLIAFLTVICALCVVMAEAPDSDGAVDETFTEGDYQFKILSESPEPYTVEITGYTGGGGAVTIPSTVIHEGTTYSVVSIGASAFDSKTSLTSVTIPGSVTSIGNQAFDWCTGLTSIDILGSVTSIGDYAFRYCKELTSVDISGEVSIGQYAFHYCTELKSISLSGEVSIGMSAFHTCSKLATIDFSGEVSIGKWAFGYCKNLTSIYISDAVKSVGDYAFYETGLSSIRFGNEIQNISPSAFGYYVSTVCQFINTTFTEHGREVFNLNDLDEFRGWTFTGDKSFMFRETRYTLTFDPDNGNDPWTEAHSSGDAITRPEDPEKTGHAFQYWMTDDGNEFIFSAMTMPGRNMTLTAAWVPVEYTVTYYSGSVPVHIERCAYGSTLVLPDEESWISNPGYTLSGWQIAGGAEVYEPGAGYLVAADVSFTAVWEAVPSPQPPEQEDDEDPIYTPVVNPGASDSGSDSTGTLAVVVAACAAAVMAALAMLVTGKPKG